MCCDEMGSNLFLIVGHSSTTSSITISTPGQLSPIFTQTSRPKLRGRRGGIESSSSLRGAVAMNNTLSEFGHTVGGSNTDGHGRKASRLGVEQASALPPLWLKVRVRRADDTLVQDVLTESHEMTRLKAMMAGLKVMPNKEVGWRPAGLPVRTHTHAHATSHAKLRPVEHIHPVPSGRRGKEAHDQMHPTDYG
jgi:hypothetical protein